MQKAEPDLDRWRTGTPKTKGGVDATRRRQRGAEQVAAYIGYRRGDPFEIWESPDGPAVELEFRVELGGVEVLGYIDQVLEAPDGSLRVRDIKTGTKLPESAFQLGVYAEAVEQMYGVRPAFGDFFMCKNNAPTSAFDLRAYTTERLGRWFARLDRAVSVGAFIPNPGDACRTCGVARFCDAVGSDRDTYGGSDLD
jgi:RecB family exonuclease